VRKRPLTHTEATEQIASLWSAFKKTRSPDARERLILHYAQLVRFVAARFGARVPASVEFDDLVSYGMIGLIEAVDRFDLHRKIRFETYAVPRIRGAMLDELRALDWVPRSVRARARELEHVRSKLRAGLRREPNVREIATEIGCNPRDLRDSYAGATRPLVALEELVSRGSGEDSDNVTVLDTIVDTTIDEPGSDAELAEIRRALLEAMQQLTDRDYTMISSYYFGEKTLAHIGAAFGVSESRVSQIHARALRTLSRDAGVRQCADGYGWGIEDEGRDPAIEQLLDDRDAALRTTRRIA